VISGFRGKTTEAVFNGESPKGFPADLVKVARRKLRYLNAADDLGDLRSPPGNRLEALAGDRKGQYSIRINDQFRVCFVWTAEGPAEVEIVDYHQCGEFEVPIICAANSCRNFKFKNRTRIIKLLVSL
jgi:toxin HigB-1